MRICSLLPAATEICFALGLGDSLVGVSHECDFPAAAARLPKVTRSHIPASLSSREIDSAVSASLESQGSLYELDLPLLQTLKPDLILTQRLCDVCAVSFDRVQEAVNALPTKPTVLNLEPSALEDIFANILRVAGAAGVQAVGGELASRLRERVDRIKRQTDCLASRPRVFCMEWVDPPYCGGHWMGELVEIAGGEDALANRRRPSYRIEWERVLRFAPEIIVLTCCGFELERCEREASILASFEGAAGLPAVQNGRVYATDGSHFFSRPGPRIVESLEILAHLIHPGLFLPPHIEAAFKNASLPVPKSACAP